MGVTYGLKLMNPKVASLNFTHYGGISPVVLEVILNPIYTCEYIMVL